MNRFIQAIIALCAVTITGAVLYVLVYGIPSRLTPLQAAQVEAVQQATRQALHDAAFCDKVLNDPTFTIIPGGHADKKCNK